MQDALSIAIEDEPVQEAGEDARRLFALLVERHSQLIYRVALAVTRNQHDAEDVTQETFLQLYRGKRWEQIEDQQAYLARIAWRLAIRRRRPRMLEQELPLDAHITMRSSEASPEQSAMDRQLEAWLYARIDALPEKLRQPLILAALKELKLVEIAKILGLPEGTVRRRIHTARQKLKQELIERKGGSYDR